MLVGWRLRLIHKIYKSSERFKIGHVFLLNQSVFILYFGSYGPNKCCEDQ